MTYNQEDALYDFLDDTPAPFTLDELVSHICMADPKPSSRLKSDAEAFLFSRHIAFKTKDNKWISRRGFFEPVPFVISPTKLELLNGILIPGHRCLPFANPELLPQEFIFMWNDKNILYTDTQGDPEEFYPYYSIYGEEYAPQYVARDNPENEIAFNKDPYEDPPEVSVQTLDMRNIYREAMFVPGDHFLVRTLNWNKGVFTLERICKNEWPPDELDSWIQAAENGFETSFKLQGPLSSTEEQIAFAYWYGGKRMCEVPAYSLEEFIYKKTERVESTSYGIETRFWYAGKEIPDHKNLDKSQARPDRTEIEEFLLEKNIPVSEYVLQSYVRDFLFRKENDFNNLMDRIIPPCIGISQTERQHLFEYSSGAVKEFRETYSPFSGRTMDPIRQRTGELHTAVIELAAKLNKGEIDRSWLPKHTFIILSQIQIHAAGVLEDLDTDDPPPDEELEAIDNSLDNMIETYEDIRRLINESLESYRRNKLTLVKAGDGEKGERLIQFSIGGTNIWRRVLVNENCRTEELHNIIQAVFNWKGKLTHHFASEKSFGLNTTIREICDLGIIEIAYEYGAKWIIKIIILSRYEIDEEKPARCVAGAGAAPPELVGGPLSYRRFVSALEGKNETARQDAKKELGQNFKPEDFDLDSCNRLLLSETNQKSKKENSPK